MRYDEVINFWFEEIDQIFWWKKDKSFDQLIIERFSDIHNEAIQGKLIEWRQSAKGTLA